MQCKPAVATLAIIVFLSAACADAARSQEFPSRPIRLVVPYPPGGASDVTARILTERMSGILGQPVVVENKPGASGQVGLELGARSAPDGYTIVYTASSAALLPSTNKSLSIDLKTAVQPIAQCCVSPLVLAVPTSLPVQNATELVAYFKANEGKINFGASGSSDMLMATSFGKSVGVNFEIVRYNGGAPALQAALSGDVHFLFLPIGTVKPMVGAGKIKILAVASPERFPSLKDVPTLAELGMSRFDSSFWYVLLAPAGTPTAVGQKLNLAVAAVLRNNDVRTRIEGYEMLPGATSIEETRRAFFENLDRYSGAAREAGVVPE